MLHTVIVGMDVGHGMYVGYDIDLNARVGLAAEGDAAVAERVCAWRARRRDAGRCNLEPEHAEYARCHAILEREVREGKHRAHNGRHARRHENNYHHDVRAERHAATRVSCRGGANGG
jgi:hypothetical protein